MSSNIIIKVIYLNRNKKITTISGLFTESYFNEDDKKKIKRKLGKECASGITITENIIKVQGDKKEELKRMMIKIGIKEENIKMGAI